jgi:hypothetical protein
LEITGFKHAAIERAFGHADKKLQFLERDARWWRDEGNRAHPAVAYPPWDSHRALAQGVGAPAWALRSRREERTENENGERREPRPALGEIGPI